MGQGPGRPLWGQACGFGVASTLGPRGWDRLSWLLSGGIGELLEEAPDCDDGLRGALPTSTRGSPGHQSGSVPELGPQLGGWQLR